MDLARFRQQFPITRTRAYLFSGAIAPAAERVRAAYDRWGELWTLDPLANYDRALDELEALRAAFARLIGADPGEVAITDNTSRASNIAVRLVANRPGSNVVVDDTTYPSSRYPWFTLADSGVRYVPTDGVPDAAAAIAERADEGTLAVTISHVAPLTGRRHDLPALAKVAHAHGGLLIVDAAQSTGVVPIDVSRDGVDILTSTAMKWLLGPPGIGFLYLRRELLEEAPPLDVGYLGLDVPGGAWPKAEMPPLLADARRLELGLPALPALAAARTGIELILEVGVEAIFDQVGTLVGRCIDSLRERGISLRTSSDPDLRAGVIAFDHDVPHEIAAFLRERGVDIGGYAWGLGRVDPHAFNTDEDNDRFLDGLDAFIATRG